MIEFREDVLERSQDIATKVNELKDLIKKQEHI